MSDLVKRARHRAHYDTAESWQKLLLELADALEHSMTVEDARNLDDVVRELGIEDSLTTPAEAVRDLKVQLERLGGGGVPDGWQLVPKDLPWEIQHAGVDALRTTGGFLSDACWSAMLAAAPPAPVSVVLRNCAWDSYAREDRKEGDANEADAALSAAKAARIGARLDRDWLRDKIESDPDLPVEAGTHAPIDRTAKAAPTGPFQSRVQPWMMETFGAEISADRVERNHRFLEEALELVQACGCIQDEAHQLVDYVYGRDQGDINQEVGGVMVTLAALCLANGFDMHAAGEKELARVWTKIDKIRAKQAAKPKHSPLPAATNTVKE